MEYNYNFWINEFSSSKLKDDIVRKLYEHFKVWLSLNNYYSRGDIVSEKHYIEYINNPEILEVSPITLNGNYISRDVVAIVAAYYDELLPYLARLKKKANARLVLNSSPKGCYLKLSSSKHRSPRLIFYFSRYFL